MSLDQANYVDEDRDLPLSYEARVLLVAQKHYREELRAMVVEHLPHTDGATADRPGAFSASTLKELVQKLQNGGAASDEPTVNRRRVEELTEMPRRESLTPYLARCFNARELAYIITELDGSREEMVGDG